MSKISGKGRISKRLWFGLRWRQRNALEFISHFSKFRSWYFRLPFEWSGFVQKLVFTWRNGRYRYWFHMWLADEHHPKDHHHDQHDHNADQHGRPPWQGGRFGPLFLFQFLFGGTEQCPRVWTRSRAAHDSDCCHCVLAGPESGLNGSTFGKINELKMKKNENVTGDE